MLNRFSIDITKGVATVAGAKPPRTLLLEMFSTVPNKRLFFHEKPFKIIFIIGHFFPGFEVQQDRVRMVSADIR